MHATLVGVRGSNAPYSAAAALVGGLSSSLNRLNDENGKNGGFFVFGDLAVRVEGHFILQFTLFEKREQEVFYITSVETLPFRVVPSKLYIVPRESSALTRAFINQGIRLKIRTSKKRNNPDELVGLQKSRRMSKRGSESPGRPIQPGGMGLEDPMPVEVPPRDLHPASSYALSPLQTSRPGVPLQQPGVVLSPQLQSKLDWRQPPKPLAELPNDTEEQPEEQPYLDWLSPPAPLVAESHGAKKPVPERRESVFHLHHTTHSYPYLARTGGQPAPPSTIEERGIFEQVSGQQSEPTQPQDTRHLSPDRIHYQQTPEYLARHVFREIRPSNPPDRAPQLPSIDDTLRIQPGALQVDISQTLPSGPLLPREGVPLIPNLVTFPDPRTGLGDLRMFPNAGQNLSAGSIGPPLSVPPSSGAMNMTSAPGDAS